jgi:hypothetical protein
MISKRKENKGVVWEETFETSGTELGHTNWKKQPFEIG